MKRIWTIGLAVVFGLLAGSVLESSRSNDAVNTASPSQHADVRVVPAVSAAPVEKSQSVDVRYAADVEIEGERFRIYVGRSEGGRLGIPPIWSVAVPADD